MASGFEDIQKEEVLVCCNFSSDANLLLRYEVDFGKIKNGKITFGPHPMIGTLKISYPWQSHPHRTDRLNFWMHKYAR